jgi:hypothetical protein
MKTLALRARVFIHCFLVFGYPGETLALVVHILLFPSLLVFCLLIKHTPPPPPFLPGFHNIKRAVLLPIGGGRLHKALTI